jgi:hypothetical protein
VLRPEGSLIISNAGTAVTRPVTSLVPDPCWAQVWRRKIVDWKSHDMEGSIFRCRGNRPNSYLDIVQKVQFKTPHVIDTSNAIHATPMGNRS